MPRPPYGLSMTRTVPFESDRLGEYLAGIVGELGGGLTVTEFSGGASNPTYLLSAPAGRYVMRRKPPGRLVIRAHAIDREYRILKALGREGYPVPGVLAYCPDVEVVGSEFYIMEYVPGRIFTDYSLPGMTAAQRSAVYDSMNAAIARLHQIDHTAIGLSDFGRPGNYFHRQISLWERQYTEQPMRNTEYEKLVEWLRENAIDDGRTCIVHGDFTLLNILISGEAPEIAAVLDWELSTIGHPLADFAYNLCHWYQPNLRREYGYETLAGKDLIRLGIPTLEEYAETYAGRMGVRLDRHELCYAIAFNLFRMVSISMGVVERIRSGTAKNQLAHTAERFIEPALKSAWSYAEAARGAHNAI